MNYYIVKLLNTHIKNFLAAVLLLTIWAGCDENNTETMPFAAYFNTSGDQKPTGWSIDYDKTGLFVVIESVGDWVLSLSYPPGGASGWCTVQNNVSLNGSGNKNVWIATTVNTGNNRRAATITVSGKDGEVKLELTQNGNGGSATETLSASFTGSQPLAWDAAGISLAVTSNTSWNVSFSYPAGTPAWCSTAGNTGSGSQNVQINTTSNSSETLRSATVTLTSASSTKTVSLTLTQNGKGAAPVLKGRWELPKIEDSAWFLEYTKGVFAMEYDISKKHSKWVAWPLYAGHFGNSGRTNAWQQDSRIPANARATDGDFPDGYDKGHMCSSGERTQSREMNEQTFFYSNMSPQKSDLNQGIWNQLELFERTWAQKAGDTLYICCGGAITNNQPIIRYSNDLAIPKYYFKVILRKRGANTWNAIGFWFENKDYSDRDKAYFLSQLNTLMKSVDEIEALTGLDFFYALPADIQTRVEAEKNKGDWNWN